MAVNVVIMTRTLITGGHACILGGIRYGGVSGGAIAKARALAGGQGDALDIVVVTHGAELPVQGA